MNFSIDNLGFLISFNMIGTLAIGLISLYIGLYIKNHSKFFNKFGIPAPVIGGILFAVIHLIIRQLGIGTIKYDTTLQDPFMVVFFTTIGIGSSIAALKKGGKLLVIFWLLSGIMTFMQTVIGVGVAKITNIHPLYGVLAGSVSMSGGHGSAGAFGKTVEQLGVMGASTMALSSATFGLLAGGLLGAPLALYLIRKNNLKAVNIVGKDDVNFEEKFSYQNITADELLKHIAVLSIIMMIGTSFSSMLKSYFDLALPSYVGAMFVAIIFNNLNVKYNFISLNRNLIDILGITSLNIFLSMALISLRLWELASLAVPMFLILFAQVLFMAFFTSQIVFKAMGKDYDAAVMISGMCGSGLGATTNAMLNMGEISERHGYTVNPYLIVTLTGAFLIDIFQMPVIIGAINMFK
ncbi:sodium/glutamate symporter (plasmid) [Cetobacterium somerae]|uniref:sodium/glutamate symporter n=1 Tax=Cetobacterium somerae TaxID=188913 RepID=UPI001F066277|nr:sodium/glutamate symporter [Cetobacterium somerae]UPO98984.1 sodium/glutamate symporter [Cetobacterium somerae]